MVDGRKQAVSIRMNTADIRKVKKLAGRLGTRDSDIIRFAVKTMLAKLAPLYDGEVRGRNLVPVFVESGTELVRFFELDASRLESIINDGTDVARSVSRDGIALIAMRGAAEPYAALKLNQLFASEPGAASGATGAPGAPGASAAESSLDLLRHYLYDKYVYRQSSAQPNGQPVQPKAPALKQNGVDHV